MLKCIYWYISYIFNMEKQPNIKDMTNLLLIFKFMFNKYDKNLDNFIVII